MAKKKEKSQIASKWTLVSGAASPLITMESVLARWSCSTLGKEATSLQAWLICCAVGVCFRCWLGQIQQKHLTHVRTQAKTHHKNICEQQNMIYPSRTIMPIPYWVEHTHANTDWGGKHAGMSQTGVFDPDVQSVTHNLRQDAKLIKRTLLFF